MRAPRKAVSALVGVLVVVILVGAAGGALFFLAPFGGAGTSSTSSSSHSSDNSSSTSFSTTSTSSMGSTSSSETTPTTSSTSLTQTSTSVLGTTTELSSTQTQTSTGSSTTCTSSYTATTGTGSFDLSSYNFTQYFATFSSMGTRFNGTTGNQSADITASYHVLYHASGVYKVDVNESVTQGSQSANVNYVIHVADSGTATSVYFSSSGYSQNYTGTEAETFYLSAMAAFIIQEVFASPTILSELTTTGFVHVTGTGSLTIGSVQLSYTDYAANSLPLMIPSCEGTTDFQAFDLQTATASGSSLVLLTSFDINGSFPTGSGNMTVDFQLQITSLTRA